jgi:uncharacterized protein (DUF1499 family)
VRLLKWLLALCAGLVLLTLGAGQMGLFSGTAPTDLGVRDGRLKPPAKTPNSVSSQARLWPDAMSGYAEVAPLALRGDGPATLARLKSIAQTMAGAKIVEARPDYLYVQFTTRLMGFVDDCEFWFDPTAQMVQVRSASRLGRKDFGVNRARVEDMRARLAGA